MNLRYQYLVDISTVVCLFVVIGIFIALFESRYSKKIYLASLAAFMILWVGFNLWILMNYGIGVLGRYMLITMTLSSLVYFFAMAKHRGSRFFFTFCLVDTVVMWVVMLTGLLDHLAGGQGLVTFVLRMVLFPVMIWGTWRFIRKPYLSLLHTVSRGWGLFAAMTAIFYISLAVVGAVPTNLRQRPEDIPFAIMLLVLLPLTYFTIFAVIYQQDELFRVRERQHTFEVQSIMMEKRIEEIYRAEHRLRIERHDLRHRLQAISTMVQQGDREAVLEYIGASQEALDADRLEHYCTNPVLDAILSNYFRQAGELGIQVEAQLAIPDELPVPTAELSTVFANALENMIHAVQKLPEENRRIVCKCINSPRFMIEFSNPCTEDVRIGSDGLPVIHEPGHGIGTRSIMAFAEKYQIVCSFRVENGWFRLQLAL